MQLQRRSCCSNVSPIIAQRPLARHCAASSRRGASSARARVVARPPSTAALDVASTTTHQQPRQQADGAASPATAPTPASEDASFKWLDAWYPLAACSALKKDRPNAAQLLNKRLVVWWDANANAADSSSGSTNGTSTSSSSKGAWRVHEDLCPHRLAPLSEGRLHESGQLQCTYHGWRFDGSGACTSIPQLDDAKAHATACSSGRSCVKSFDVFEHLSLLWVHAGGDGGRSNGSSGAEPPAHLLAPPGYQLMSPWFQRDVPVGWDLIAENMTDPAHVPQSHHGIIGDRDALQTLTMAPKEPMSRDSGYSVLVHTPSRWGMQEVELEFRPPCLVRHNFPGVTMLLYNTPTATGSSRIVMSFVAPPGTRATRPATPQLPGWLNVLLDGIDRVPALQHALNRNAIIDGDTYFLHVAERELCERGGSASWPQNYYLPGSSDAAVVSLRKWIDVHGGALPTARPAAASGEAAAVPALLPREVVLDRLGQHTKHCPHCSAALRAATIGAAVCAALAAVAAGAVVAAVVAGAAPLASPFCAAAAGVAALAGAVAALLMRARRLYIFTDWVHAEH